MIVLKVHNIFFKLCNNKMQCIREDIKYWIWIKLSDKNFPHILMISLNLFLWIYFDIRFYGWNGFMQFLISTF